MKVALVHDYIKEYGGAERVLEALHELYPEAPVFTTVYLPQYLGPHQERFKKWTIKTSVLQYLPLKAKLISPFRLITPFIFKTFNFSKYDVIIVSATGAYNPNILRKKKALQICYCHTPPRYLYGYATARILSKNPVIKTVSAIANHLLRIVDFTSSKNVDVYIANSNEVKKRIQKFYRKEAIIIYPPVDIISHESQSTVQNSERNYFLAGGRLARPKNIDILVKACTQLNVPLKVFGKGFAGYGQELEKMAGESVEFLGEVNDGKKWELLHGAKAFLFASEDEDFGIVPVEAMAAGTPVVAYRSGGVVESIVEGRTGLFFDSLNVESVKKVLQEFGTHQFYPNVCKKRAEAFSKERFQKEIEANIAKTYEHFKKTAK